MSEKYYIVSQTELINLIMAAYKVADSHPARVDEIQSNLKLEDKAYEFCTTRSVVYMSTEHDDDEDCTCILWKEIKK